MENRHECAVALTDDRAGPVGPYPYGYNVVVVDAKVVMPVNRQAQKSGAADVLVRPPKRPSRLSYGKDEAPRGGRLGRGVPVSTPDVSAKLTLASRLNVLLDERGLTQSAASQLMGMPQPKVSAIRNYKLRGISLERLMQALAAFDQQVEIIVKPSLKAGGGSIRVAA